MAHWDWQTISTVVTLAVLLLGLVWRGFRHITKQNEEQLRRQRRIDREVFGEDSDAPDAPKGPSLRTMVSQVIDQTRPLASTVEEHGRRLGKHDSELSDHAIRLTELERVVLRQVPPL